MCYTMGKLGVVLIFVIVLLSSFSIAQINIVEPKDVYNLGDKIYIDVYGITWAESGNLNIDLSCGDDLINLLKIPRRSFLQGIEQNYSVPYKILNEEDLEIIDIKDIVGDCNIKSSLGDEEVSSKTFEVSNELEISANFDKENYNPGENAEINIEVKKKSGESFNGRLIINGEEEYKLDIENGVALYNIEIEQNQNSGSYNYKLIAYDGDEEDWINRGETEASFSVNSVPSELIISLSSDKINPGENLEVGLEIKDQGGNLMEGLGNLRIVSPIGEEINEEIGSGKFKQIFIESNATPGNWEILGEFEDLTNRRNFEVLIFPRVEFDIEGTLLKVRNIGNGVYNKSIIVKIGEEEKSLGVREIGIGDEIEFNLRAPDGEYLVSASDGDSSFDRTVYLTGRAVSVENPGGSSFASYSIFIWIFFIIILAAAGAVLYFYSTKNKVIKNGKIKEKFENLKSKVLRKKTSEEEILLGSSNKKSFFGNKKEEDVDLTKSDSSNAESSLVLKGDKQKSVILSLRIKNYSELGDNSKRELINIVKEESKSKGLIDWKEDYVFVVFSPLVTKTYSNEVLACKSGINIQRRLNEFNRKFENKIDYNIGIHVGDLVSSKENEKLKYTSIGNTVSLSKKISDFSRGKVLVSEEIRRKLLRDLKVEKEGKIGENLVYSIVEVKDKEANAAKLKDILKRM